MKLGLGLIGRLWRRLKRGVFLPNYESGPFARFAADESLEADAESMRGLSTDPSALSLEDATLVLTWLTDPRFMYYISTLSNVLLCTASAEGALLTVAIVRHGFIDKEIRFAFPRDLADYTCDGSRVWVLSPVADSGYMDFAES